MKKSIIIAGHKIKIKYQTKDIIDENGNLLNGCYDHENNEIKIDKKLPEQNINSTLNHEILHAIDMKYDIGLKHKQIYQLTAALDSMGIKL